MYGTTITGTSASSVVWTNWCQFQTVASGSYYHLGALTPAQQEQHQREHDAQRAARLEADRKAEELLLRHLTPAQRAEYQSTGSFCVKLDSGALYRIKKGRSGNVELAAPEPLVEGASDARRAANRFVPIERFCIHPIEQVPDCDTMLAQKLLLETDEATFRRVANITQLRRTA